MKCSLKVLSCISLILLASSVDGKKHCANITCPPLAEVRAECNSKNTHGILAPNNTKLCCTYCVKILEQGESCSSVTGFTEPPAAMCRVECDLAENKCIEPQGSDEKVVKPKPKTSGCKVKAALLESSLLVLDVVLSLAGTFCLVR